MAKQIQLKAKSREEAGKTRVRRLRKTGAIPGIVYGAHTKPVTVAINADDFTKALHHATSENVLVDLQVEEGGKAKSRLTLIQEVQHHPVTDMILHVDFHEVSATEKLRTAVPVRAIGEPAGVKTGGGILEYVMRDLRVECLPKDLPEVVEVNVEKLEIGQGIHVGDIQAPPGVTLLDQKEQAVFIVAAPITEEELAAMTEAAAATAAEPEVIGEKKLEGEEAVAEEGAEGKAKPEAGKPAAAGKPEAGKAEAKPAPPGKAEAKPAAGKPAAPAKTVVPGKPAAPGKPEAKK
jgi:large subunit ribosomal protein L25